MKAHANANLGASAKRIVMASVNVLRAVVETPTKSMTKKMRISAKTKNLGFVFTARNRILVNATKRIMKTQNFEGTTQRNTERDLV